MNKMSAVNVLDISQHSINSYNHQSTCAPQYGLELDAILSATPPPVDYVFTGLAAQSSQSPKFGVDDGGDVDDDADVNGDGSDSDSTGIHSTSASASPSDLIMNEEQSESRTRDLGKGRMSALQIMRRGSSVVSASNRDGCQSGSGSRSRSGSHSASTSFSDDAPEAPGTTDKRRHRQRHSDGHRHGHPHGHLHPLDTSSGSELSSSITNSNTNPINNSTDKKPSFRVRGERCDRDTFLQKTKSRSWANMKGYDSLDRPHRKPHNARVPWVSGPRASTAMGTGTTKHEEFSRSSDVNMNIHMSSMPSPSRVPSFPPRSSRPLRGVSVSSSLHSHPHLLDKEIRTRNTTPSPTRHYHSHEHIHTGIHMNMRNDPYTQHAQYAERLKRKSTQSAEIASFAHLMRDRQALQSADFIRHSQDQRPAVEEPTTIPPDIVSSSSVNSSVHSRSRHTGAGSRSSGGSAVGASSSVTGANVHKSILIQQSHNERKSKVSFSNVEVRQYERIMGDNPACSSGPPISIGWNFYEEKTISMTVDDFDYYHGMNRDEINMVLTRQEREELLLDLGYTSKELADAVRKNIKWKNRRRQTVNNLSVMKMEELVESTLKHLGRIAVPKHRRGGRGRGMSGRQLYIQWKDSYTFGPGPSETSADDFSSASTLKSCLKLGNSEKTSASSTFSHVNAHCNFSRPLQEDPLPLDNENSMDDGGDDNEQ